ncbi:Methylmalonate-semialdehyde dehydrogenase [acylating] mitochondrial [Ascosphaera pollenicola]|nr:Methylmalonate-semialdehyde dehydrogenase [acylating] mitochondrial [Ascosphaera pollenicola]
MAARQAISRSIIPTLPARLATSSLPRTAATTLSVRHFSLRATRPATAVKASSLSTRHIMPSQLLGSSTPASVRNLATSTAMSSASASSLGPANSPKTGYPMSHEKIANPVDTANFLDNEFVASQATDFIELHDPATNELVTRVPQSTDAELKAAVGAAEEAFPGWKSKSIMARQQIMFKFVNLIRENWDRLAANITLEQGKTFADAQGDVLRGLQVAETACGITTQITGEVLEVAKDMETRSYREPLGVVAAICPFSEFLA